MVRLVQFPIWSCSTDRCSRSILPPRVRNWEQMDEHIHVEDSLSQEPAQIFRIPQKEGGGDNSDPPALGPLQLQELAWPGPTHP